MNIVDKAILQAVLDHDQPNLTSTKTQAEGEAPASLDETILEVYHMMDSNASLPCVLKYTGNRKVFGYRHDKTIAIEIRGREE